MDQNEMDLKDDISVIEDLDKTIHTLVELRKRLTKKTGQQKGVVSMTKFLDMLRKDMPSFKNIVNELERFRIENNFDGVVINAGLYGIEEPQTNVWWTVVNPIDNLLAKDVDVSSLFDILANQTRLQFLKFLTMGRKTYSEISEHLQIRGGGFAHHAMPLLRMKCIEKEGRGTYGITELGWEVLVSVLSLATRIGNA
ncbi:ArsR family transcriptional regulator [Candidatus Thorarchaeota archaeon]|nr:MAG: ArsR family transcriptional regulator [Candidatus Thorarchaeota archaeon]